MTFLDEGAEDVGDDAENGESDDGNVLSYSFASTCIANLTYHRDTQELFMTFTKGGYYVIEGFPEAELRHWVTAESVGGYFNEFVRGNYA